MKKFKASDALQCLIVLRQIHDSLYLRSDGVYSVIGNNVTPDSISDITDLVATVIARPRLAMDTEAVEGFLDDVTCDSMPVCPNCGMELSVSIRGKRRTYTRARRTYTCNNKDCRLQLELEKTKQGWKIVADMTPGEGE